MPGTGTTETTTQANELCFGAVALDLQNATTAPTSSFTEVLQRTSGTPDLVVMELIVSATGAYSSTVGFGGSPPVSWASAGTMITLKEASAATARPSHLQNRVDMPPVTTQIRHWSS